MACAIHSGPLLAVASVLCNVFTAAVDVGKRISSQCGHSISRLVSVSRYDCLPSLGMDSQIDLHSAASCMTKTRKKLCNDKNV